MPSHRNNRKNWLIWCGFFLLCLFRATKNFHSQFLWRQFFSLRTFHYTFPNALNDWRFDCHSNHTYCVIVWELCVRLFVCAEFMPRTLKTFRPIVSLTILADGAFHIRKKVISHHIDKYSFSIIQISNRLITVNWLIVVSADKWFAFKLSLWYTHWTAGHLSLNAMTFELSKFDSPIHRHTSQDGSNGNYSPQLKFDLEWLVVVLRIQHWIGIVLRENEWHDAINLLRSISFNCDGAMVCVCEFIFRKSTKTSIHHSYVAKWHKQTKVQHIV